MFEIDSPAVIEFLSSQLWVIVFLLFAAAACALAALGAATNRRRARAIAVVLGDSTRSALRYVRRPDVAGFSAHFAPAPEPFKELNVDFSAATYFSPIDLLNRLVRGRTEGLRITGRLSGAPANEIVWSKHHAPDRALGRGRAHDLWVEKRLDFIHGDYTLRGVNVNSIDHAFSEMQRRFGAFAQSISVLDGHAAHVVVVLQMTGFNSEEIPALVAALRSLARAALIE